MAGFSFVLLSKSGPERVYTFIIKKKTVERNRKKITKTRHTKLEKAEMKKWAADAFSFDLCVYCSCPSKVRSVFYMQTSNACFALLKQEEKYVI